MNSESKTLYLVRHAKSDWGTGLRDFERPLNKRGRRDAPEMGQRLKKRGVKPGVILCSPALRTRQTLELLDLEADPVFDENIYEASPNTLLDIIHRLDDRCGSAMIIGHNPSVSWLAQELSSQPVEGMPTCAVATLEINTARWQDVGDCTTRLLDFDYPKHCPDDSAL